MPSTPSIPERFRPAYQAIQRLERHERYLGAFIYGSVARGETFEHSSLYVTVIVNTNDPPHPNHPVIEGITLNLGFISLKRLEALIKNEIGQCERKERANPLTIAESIIIFDKAGRLRHMQEEARLLQPHEIGPWKQQSIQAMHLNYNDRVECHLKKDPHTALLVMHTGLSNLLRSHYQLNRKWYVTTQRLFADLHIWDAELAQLVESFVATSEVETKFQWWTAIIDHILQPPGGRHPIAARSCTCSQCQNDVAMLLES